MRAEPSKNTLFDVFFSGRFIIDFHEDMFSRETVLFSTATKYGARNFMKNRFTHMVAWILPVVAL